MPSPTPQADSANLSDLPEPEPTPRLPLPGPQAATFYRPPELLRDLRLLDALELTGTTEQAGRWLAVSQPTVSRRCRRLAEDFGLSLQPRQAKRSRLGCTVSLRQLRLGARWHRFEAGVVVLGTDPLHQGLLEGLTGLLPVPQRFRPGEAWLDLVRNAVIDAALVSSLELERPEVGQDLTRRRSPPGEGRWPLPAEPDRLHLGHWPLRLAVEAADAGGAPPRLLVPPAPLAPGLRSLLGGQGLMVECPPSAVDNLAAWRRRMAGQGLAAALPAWLLDQPHGPMAGLQALEPPCQLREHLWLLLPPDWRGVPVLRHTVAGLRRLAARAGALPEEPETPPS